MKFLERKSHRREMELLEGLLPDDRPRLAGNPLVDLADELPSRLLSRLRN